MIFTGIVGPEFWRKAYIFGIPNYSLMMVFSIVGGLATIASFGVSVFKKLKWNPFLIFKSLVYQPNNLVTPTDADFYLLRHSLIVAI